MMQEEAAPGGALSPVGERPNGGSSPLAGHKAEAAGGCVQAYVHLFTEQIHVSYFYQWLHS